MRRLLIAFLVALVAAGLSAAAYRLQPADTTQECVVEDVAVPMSTSLVERTTLQSKIETTGDVAANATVVVSAEVSGLLEQFDLERGDAVAAGDAIGRLNSDQAAASLQTAQAAVRVAQARLLRTRTTLDKADKDLHRVQTLFQQNVATQQTLDDALSQVETSRAAVAEAEASIEHLERMRAEAQLAVERHTIKAPLAGVVSKRLVERGEYVRAGQPLIALADVSRMKVRVSVSERNLPLLCGGCVSARFVTEACPGRHFAGTVTLIDPTVDPATRTIGAEVTVSSEGAAEELKPGMSCDVTLCGAAREVTVVPRDALRRIAGTAGWFVFVVKDGRVQQREIACGEGANGRVEVIRGLEPGEEVAVSGLSRLRSGDRVRVVNAVDVPVGMASP